VALPKICGIETEYGITHRGVPDANPITASSVLINAYLQRLAGNPEGGVTKVGWDFEDETPGNDARGVPPAEAMAPEVETHLVNAVLTNGARFYVDHAHPELSTPECADARSVVVWDRAAEQILAEAMSAAHDLLPAGQEIVVYKNNSDRKGNSTAATRTTSWTGRSPSDASWPMSPRTSSAARSSAGRARWGPSWGGRADTEVTFQLTQRAEFFEEEVGLETTLKRPIVNTRDEPHADAQKYRRLHVIVGDANMSEVATFLKVGSTLFVLSMIEDDFLPRTFELAAPVWALRAVSFDLSLRRPLELSDGTTVTALEIQWELYDRARKYAEDRDWPAWGRRPQPRCCGAGSRC
jgi:Pup amidohydrolase